jgi:hypothetical protein
VRKKSFAKISEIKIIQQLIAALLTVLVRHMDDEPEQLMECKCTVVGESSSVELVNRRR